MDIPGVPAEEVEEVLKLLEAYERSGRGFGDMPHVRTGCRTVSADSCCCLRPNLRTGLTHRRVGCTGSSGYPKQGETCQRAAK